MINHSRRTILKSLGYGVALTAGAASSTAWAFAQKAPQAIPSALPTCDITILQAQSNGKEMVSIMNLTDKVVTLDEITPVGLEHVNGSLKVNINRVKDGAIVLQPSERLSFEVEAIGIPQAHNELQIPNVLAGHLKISSDHPAFNGIIPVTVFDAQTA